MKGRNTGLSNRANTLDFGTYGLKATSRGHKPITKKPLEVRQGKGKGNVEYYVCPIKPGKILYEMEGVDEEIAMEAFRLAASKLPVETKFIVRKTV